MSETTCLIRGVDTLLFRDGRPFSDEAGAHAETILLPMPSTVAGFLRSRYGLAKYADPSGHWADVSEGIRLRGPLLTRGAEVLLPAPADVLVYRLGRDNAERAVTTLRPWDAGELDAGGAGTDIPSAMRPMKVEVDRKPARGFDFWTWSNMAAWLEERPISAGDLEADLGPRVDHRVHIEMDAVTRTSKEGQLFSTAMVAFEHYAWENFEKTTEARYSLLCRVAAVEDASLLFGVGTLGGENRCAVVSRADSALWPSCPPTLAAKLADSERVRMILATPAIFETGWIPRWLDKTTKIGAPPGLEERLTLKLVSAAVPRRQAMSGWGYSTEHSGRPKPLRWCAPAGSVYFFEKVRGDMALLATEGWLAPVSDDEETRTPGRTVDKNRSDGFGLALWGLWNKDQDEKERTL